MPRPVKAVPQRSEFGLRVRNADRRKPDEAKSGKDTGRRKA